jgi:hypothetical protein
MDSGILDEMTSFIRETFKNIWERDSNGVPKEVTEYYLIIWYFFENFVLYREDRQRLLSIRNFYFKYIFQVDVNKNEIFRRHDMNYSSSDNISDLVERIKLSLRTCDFITVSNIFLSLNKQFYNNFYLETNDFGKTCYDFAEVFNILAVFFYSLDRILSETYQDEASLLEFSDLAQKTV